MSKVLIEICVDNVESVLAASRGGADRIELCSALGLGGLSPSVSFLKYIRPLVDIKIYPMVRPRTGDFIYSNHEFEIMKNEIIEFKEAGADGIVFGILMADGEVDLNRTKELVDLAYPLDVTFHRAFDMTKDPFNSLEQLKALGVNRVLTSGLKNTAIEGIELISLLSEENRGVTIMPGSGINLENIKDILGIDGVKEIHLSAKKRVKSKMSYRNTYINMGRDNGDEYSIYQTDENIVRNIRAFCDKYTNKDISALRV